MAKERLREIAKEDLVIGEQQLEEIEEIAGSENDVTWTTSAVTIVLRSKEEMNRAMRLGFLFLGSTLVILRTDSSGIPVNSDDTIRQCIRAIKNS